MKNALGKCGCRCKKNGCQQVIAQVSFDFFRPPFATGMGQNFSDTCYCCATVEAIYSDGSTASVILTFAKDGTLTAAPDLSSSPSAEWYGITDKVQAGNPNFHGGCWMPNKSTSTDYIPITKVSVALSQPYTFSDACALATTLLGSVPLLSPGTVYPAGSNDTETWAAFQLGYPWDAIVVGSTGVFQTVLVSPVGNTGSSVQPAGGGSLGIDFTGINSYPTFTDACPAWQQGQAGTAVAVAIETDVGAFTAAPIQYTKAAVKLSSPFSEQFAIGPVSMVPGQPGPVVSAPVTRARGEYIYEPDLFDAGAIVGVLLNPASAQYPYMPAPQMASWWLSLPALPGTQQAGGAGSTTTGAGGTKGQTSGAGGGSGGM